MLHPRKFKAGGGGRIYCGGNLPSRMEVTYCTCTCTCMDFSKLKPPTKHELLFPRGLNQARIMVDHTVKITWADRSEWSCRIWRYNNPPPCVMDNMSYFAGKVTSNSHKIGGSALHHYHWSDPNSSVHSSKMNVFM